jgi:hypothetical protein
MEMEGLSSVNIPYETYGNKLLSIWGTKFHEVNISNQITLSCRVPIIRLMIVVTWKK